MNIRPKILLSGFFGRGNCGDEAILQVQYNLLHKYFDCVISIDHHDAYDGFWNWYPYNQCELIHTSNLNYHNDSRFKVIHVGGGGLPFAFNAAQVLSGRMANIPLAMSGIDFNQDLFSQNSEILFKNYMGLFDLIAPRTQISVERIKSLSLPYQKGVDWAFGLKTDEVGDINALEAILVVIRELPSQFHFNDYAIQLQDLINKIEESTRLPIRLVPFCPEDERFISDTLRLTSWPLLRHWWNPARMQRIISESKAVLSIGRLHPLVMAANVEKPAIYIEPISRNISSYVTNKVKDMSDQISFAYFNSINEALTEINDNGIKLSKTYWTSRKQNLDCLCDQVNCIKALAD